MFEKLLGKTGSAKEAQKGNDFGFESSIKDTRQEIDDVIDPKATKLIIEREDGTAENSSSKQRFDVKLLNLGRSQINKPYSYYRLSNLSRTDNIQVLMRTDQGLKNIRLPEQMLSNIARFIREDSKPREERFDCASFAHLVNDIPYEFGNYQAKNWDMRLLSDENNLKPGDTIAIANTDNPNNFSNGDITHFGIYLGDSLYLSKFGNKGKLIVANLEEMKKGFGGDYFFQANPKK
ncbi:MAG: hypothetical protein WCW25_02565 [Patescibacteria group bacterium]|jgi:cell wall-associated NlpC family hydrolase